MEVTTWHKLLRTAIIIAMPFFLGLGMILLVIDWNWPSYPAWEYGRIPPDRYGLSLAERLDLAQQTLAYLRQPGRAADVIYLLEELRLPDGELLYNEREIGHMLDVKNVVDNIRFVWLMAGIIVVVGSLAMVLKPETALFGWRTIMYGGIFTVITLLAIALFILLAWDTFFVQFHELLFPPGSWTFNFSDGLIRLFPEQFWFDIGVIMSGGALLLGVVTAVLGYLMAQRISKQ
jgi:integral membrane protein (TIGR01906 family)